MDERQHTPGKLRVTSRSTVANCVHVLSEDGLFQTGCIEFSGRGHANAERIVATWNACEGMADPQATITALVTALKDGLTIVAHVCNLLGTDKCWRCKASAALALVPPAVGQGK